MTTASTSSSPSRDPHTIRIVGLVALLLLVAVTLLIAVLNVATAPSLLDRASGTGVEGSGSPASEVREVAPFTSVDLAGSNEVSISVGTTQSVRVEADDNLLDLVTTRVRAGELVIDNDGDFQTRGPMRVQITLPELDAVTLSGSGTVSLQGIDTETLTVRLPGSGVIRAAGSVDRLRATLVGSGELLLDAVTAARATAVLSGSGLIRLTASDSLAATVSGSGTILYGGDPSSVIKSVTGSGAIIET